MEASPQLAPQIGRVVAVCRRATAGIPKEVVDAVTVGPLGVLGDFHAGPINRHKKRGRPEPNYRHITVVAQEAVDAVAADLEFPPDRQIEPGDLGENFLVAGLGDLSAIGIGDRLRLGDQAEIEVTGHNRPCATLRRLGFGIEKAFKGRRGLLAIVKATGVVRPGDAVVWAPGEMAGSEGGIG